MTPRAIALVAWPAIFAWSGFVAWRAHAELTADLVVVGPERTWRSPYEDVDGWVLDPRRGTLAAELRDRYRPGAPVPDTDDPVAALRALSIAVAEGRGLGDGLLPRVMLRPEGPLLVVGAYARDPVAFDPARGVVRLHTLAPDLPALVLTDAVEAPY